MKCGGRDVALWLLLHSMFRSQPAVIQLELILKRNDGIMRSGPFSLSLSTSRRHVRDGSHLVEHELGGRASGGETSAPRLLEIESARQPIGVEQLAGEKNARRDTALTAVAN